MAKNQFNRSCRIPSENVPKTFNPKTETLSKRFQYLPTKKSCVFSNQTWVNLKCKYYNFRFRGHVRPFSVCLAFDEQEEQSIQQFQPSSDNGLLRSRTALSGQLAVARKSVTSGRWEEEQHASRLFAPKPAPPPSSTHHDPVRCIIRFRFRFIPITIKIAR